jgi:hypothetical protein
MRFRDLIFNKELRESKGVFKAFLDPRHVGIRYKLLGVPPVPDENAA